jgi:hypothetical protein
MRRVIACTGGARGVGERDTAFGQRSSSLLARSLLRSSPAFGPCPLRQARRALFTPPSAPFPQHHPSGLRLCLFLPIPFALSARNIAHCPSNPTVPDTDTDTALKPEPKRCYIADHQHVYIHISGVCIQSHEAVVLRGLSKRVIDPPFRRSAGNSSSWATAHAARLRFFARSRWASSQRNT